MADHDRPAERLRDAVTELKRALKQDAEVAVNAFEEKTGLSIGHICIQMHELSASPHPLYAVADVDVEIVTE